MAKKGVGGDFIPLLGVVLYPRPHRLSNAPSFSVALYFISLSITMSESTVFYNELASHGGGEQDSHSTHGEMGILTMNSEQSKSFERSIEAVLDALQNEYVTTIHPDAANKSLH